MDALKEPALFNIYISTKKQEVTDVQIGLVLSAFIRGDEVSMAMQLDMIKSGSDIIIGTHPKDIAESRVNSINSYCFDRNIKLFSWVKRRPIENQPKAT